MAKEKKQLKLMTKAELRKKYPGSDLASIVIPSREETLWLPCDIIALNHFLGGGIPYGKVLLATGFESTGKSLLAMAFGRACQALGGILLQGDLENAWARYWAEQNGIDNERVEILAEPSIEVLSDWVKDYILFYRAQLTNNEPILFVVDSIAMAEKKAALDQDQDDAKAEMGGRAKAIGDFLRRRSNFFYKYGVCVILVNQLRDKLNTSMFESNETMPGGKAPQFTASQWLALVRGKQIKYRIKGKDRKIGQNIYIQHRKNKVGPPQDNIATQVYFRADNEFGYVGFNKYMGLPDILVEQGVIKKKGSRYYRKDKMIANGEDNLIRILHDNDDLRSTLLRKSDINTIGKTRKKLEGIKENRFPVKLKVQKEADDE